MSNGETLRLYVAGPKSKTPGAINVVEDTAGDNKWYGRITNLDYFEPGKDSTPAIENFIEKFAVDPVTAARAYGKITGNCCFCARELTDARSLTVGYGPVCADNYGLPWGDINKELVNAEFDL